VEVTHCFTKPYERESESADKPSASGRDSPNLQALQTEVSYRLYQFVWLNLYQFKWGKCNTDFDQCSRWHTLACVFVARCKLTYLRMILQTLRGLDVLLLRASQ